MEVGSRKNKGPALISREGFERLYWQLQYLIRISREEVAENLKDARSHGRNPRNLELRTAKEKRHWIEWSITRLEREMRSCQVVVSPPLKDGRVHFGSRVRLHNLRKKREEVFLLVGEFESDPARGLLSVDSPLGRAVLGKRAGAGVEVETPEGGKGVLPLRGLLRGRQNIPAAGRGFPNTFLRRNKEIIIWISIFHITDASPGPFFDV